MTVLDGFYLYIRELFQTSGYLYALFVLATVLALSAGLGVAHELLRQKVEGKGEHSCTCH